MPVKVKDSYSRIKPLALALASGRGRYKLQNVTPERALFSDGKWRHMKHETAMNQWVRSGFDPPGILRMFL
jgi:hypothetical protein